MRSLASEVPIELNVEITWLADVSMKKLLLPLAQYCSTREVGSPSVQQKLAPIVGGVTRTSGQEGVPGGVVAPRSVMQPFHKLISFKEGGVD